MSEDIDMILMDAEEKMDKAIGVARDDFAPVVQTQRCSTRSLLSSTTP